MEPVLFYYGLLFLISVLHRAASRVDGYGGWNNVPNTQYHIQTDEGEERFFKYQTTSGQYRKEKRLQDGTVIGTYGWVDPNGYLRLRDYIADNAGYRILKSRMLFVGDNNDIGESVAVAKRVPGTAGDLVSPNSSPFNSYQVAPTRNAYIPPAPAYVPPSPTQQTYTSYLPPSQQSPTQQTYTSYLPPSQQTYPASTPFNIYIPANTVQSTTPASTYPFYSSTPASLYTPTTPSPVQYYSSTPASPVFYGSSTPLVDIYPNSAPKTGAPLYISSTLAPPVESTPQAFAAYSTTPRPVSAYSSTPRPVSVYSSTPRPVSVYSSTPRPVGVSYSTPETVTPVPKISAIGTTAAPPLYDDVKLPPISGKFASSPNNFITETEKNQLFYKHENRGYYQGNRGYYRKRFVDQRANEQEYDGISTVQNGFRYFLPKMYHEEQSSRDGQDRVGSFGYVDPFGIRRVVYYNSSPGRGFVHRKNNRYVGHDAAPYDPRPV